MAIANDAKLEIDGTKKDLRVADVLANNYDTSRKVEIPPKVDEPARSWVSVMSVIGARYAVELILGTATKSVYKNMCGSPSGVLLFEIVSFFPIIFVCHAINSLGFSFIPSVFGGKWKFEWRIMKGYTVAGIFLASMLLLKQQLNKNTGGPGYAEMLSCMSVPIGAILQYFINKTRTGLFGIIAAILCAATAILAGIICGPMNFLYGTLAALCNALRSSVVKKSSTKYVQAIGLNVIYAQIACFPIYLILLIYSEVRFIQSGDPTTASLNGLPGLVGGSFGKLEISGLFRWYWDWLPFYRIEYCVIVIMSLMSNILVMTIFHMCSPLSYLVSCQFKGILQIVVDLLYIDYYFVYGLNWTIYGISGVSDYFNALKFKNVKEITWATITGICTKCAAAVFYIMEKVHGRRKRETQEAEANCK